MITLLKRLGIAALALAIPALAQAAVLDLNRDANTDINSGNFYSYLHADVLTAGSYDYFFPLTTFASPGSALTINLALDGDPNNIVKFTAASFGITGDGAFPSLDLGGLGTAFLSASILNIPFALGGDYLLTLSFTIDGTALVAGSTVVSAVPLPAAGLLLIGGLGGLGFVARRRKSIEA